MTRTTLSLLAFLSTLLWWSTSSQWLRAEDTPVSPAPMENVEAAPLDDAASDRDEKGESDELSLAEPTEGSGDRGPEGGTSEATEPSAKPDDAPTLNGIDGEAAEGKSVNEPRELGIPADLPLTPSFEENLTPELVVLRDRVRRVLSSYYHEPITTGNHSPWGIMHALIAYGVDTEIYHQDRKVNAIGWLCYNGVCRGQQLMYVENGKLRVRIGPGVQGHPGQFLAMLAQSRVRTDYPIKVDGQNFTVADLIESEKEGCRARTELTFKLIALSHYLKTDAKWTSDIGEEWSIPRLIKEELAQPVVGSACGGTHRMTGFSYAVNKRLKMNEPFDGQWLRAQKFVDAYHEYIFKLQNSDGSFSTNWFAGRGDNGDHKRHVETTGHMLEWLVCSLPKEQLDDPRVVRAVEHLTSLFEEARQSRVKYEIGPRGHALHGLAIYAERRFGDKPGSRDLILARKPAERSATR